MKKIVVVEDEQAVRKMLIMFFTRRGWQVEAYASADMVLENGINGAHALITDVVMPGKLSGADLALRVREVLPDLPIVVISGFTSDCGPALQEALENDKTGMRFAQKPVPFAKLTALLGELGVNV